MKAHNKRIIRAPTTRERSVPASEKTAATQRVRQTKKAQKQLKLNAKALKREKTPSQKPPQKVRVLKGAVVDPVVQKVVIEPVTRRGRAVR